MEKNTFKFNGASARRSVPTVFSPVTPKPVNRLGNGNSFPFGGTTPLPWKDGKRGIPLFDSTLTSIPSSTPIFKTTSEHRFGHVGDGDAAQVPSPGLFRVPATSTPTISTPASRPLAITEMQSVSSKSKISVIEEEESEDDSLCGIANDVFDTLCLEFFEAAKEKPALPLLDEYSSLCDKTLEYVQFCSANRAQPDPQIFRYRQMGSMLEKEKATWCLLRALYGERCGHSDKDLCPPEWFVKEPGVKCSIFVSRNPRPTPAYVSEKMVVCRRYRADLKIREYRVVVDWLEARLRLSSPPLKRILRELALGGGFGLMKGEAELPASELSPFSDLSPDAQKRLAEALVKIVKTGQKDVFLKLCDAVGQPWRKSLMSGGSYYHDPNRCSDDTRKLLPIEGNASRVLWKSTTLSQSEDPSVPAYDRNLYALVAGNLSRMLPLAESWEEALLMYFKCLLDQELEREIFEKLGLGPCDYPESYWKQDLSPETIFRELETSPNPEIRRQSQHPLRKLMKAIILDDPGCYRDLSWEADDPEFADELSVYGQQLTRFQAHFVQFLQVVAIPRFPLQVTERALMDYIRIMKEKKFVNAVFFFIAAIPSENLREDLLTEALKDFKADEGLKSRTDIMARAEAFGLDAKGAARRVVSEAREECRGEALPRIERGGAAAADLDPLEVFCSSRVSKRDEERIATLDWLLNEERDSRAAAAQVNAMARTFLLQRKVNAARLTLSKMSSKVTDALSPKFSKYARFDETVAIYTEDERHLNEFEGLSALTVAFEQYELWSKHIVSAPRKSVAEYRAKYFRLKDSAVDILKRVLDFPFGWLEDRGVDGAEDDGGDETTTSSFWDRPVGSALRFAEEAKARRSEIAAIKRLYFPAVLRMLSKISAKACPVEAPADEACEGKAAWGKEDEMISNAMNMWDGNHCLLQKNRSPKQDLKVEGLESFRDAVLSIAIDASTDVDFFGFTTTGHGVCIDPDVSVRDGRAPAGKSKSFDKGVRVPNGVPDVEDDDPMD